ncbi:hypothetical protein PLEI_2968 [Photobacterium leiognathi lrivu.4.1]|uniref:Uncharacterized protein n=1 Tax=Photobacterium leiognathi lrivu.4.1 TaxID=1248232 RepID=V5F282_PHOLE|nr:hypothetical protein PLEI_2968 [Photobacterium leiognathi lrivu.4.1]
MPDNFMASVEPYKAAFYQCYSYRLTMRITDTLTAQFKPDTALLGWSEATNYTIVTAIT